MFTNAMLIENQERLTRFAYKLTRNKADAEDLVQATLLQAMEKRDMYTEDSNFYGWLSKIMYNGFVTRYRRKTKFESQYDPEPFIESQKVEARQEAQVRVKEVQTALESVPAKYREVLELVCFEGMPYKAVAKKLDMPIGTVRSRLARARTQLQEALVTPKSNVIKLRTKEAPRVNRIGFSGAKAA